MSFTQLKRIKEIDSTVEQAVASYGSFVKLTNNTRDRVRKSSRRDWSTARILLNNCDNAIPTFHKAIMDKFGFEAMVLAINTHPLD